MKQCIKKNRLLFIVSIGLSIIYAIFSILSAKILQEVLDISLVGDMDRFKEVLVFAVLFLVVMAVLTYSYGIVNKRVTNRILMQYRNSIYQGIMKRSYQEYYQSNSAEYLSALTNDIKMVEENYLEALLMLMQNVCILIATIAMLLYLSIIVTVALLISVILMIVIPSMLGKRLQEKQEAVSKQLQELTTKTKDIFSGFEVIKTFHVFRYMQTLFYKKNKELTDSKMEADTLLVINESISGILGSLCQFVVIFVSSYLIIKGEITAGTSLALIQLSGMFVMPIIQILTNVPKIQGITPVITKLDALMTYVNAQDKDTTLTTFTDKIEVEDVSFGYQEDLLVIDNVTMEIKKGKKYAILGKSGCGKSTLVKLLSGYYDSYTGNIKYDSFDGKEYAIQSANSLIATIHQDVYMFDTTIRDNITLHDSYSEEQLQIALQRSGVDQFINTFDKGLESPVGENGNLLSGGQRQRIAIARALIRNTPILILDEGTSAIDKQTAYAIESELLQIPELTILTITHNLNQELLQQYDEIIYMEEGKVTYKESLATLLASKNTFSEQFS